VALGARLRRARESFVAGAGENRTSGTSALQGFLEEGLSLAQIGRRLDRHESTVAYWIQK